MTNITTARAMACLATVSLAIAAVPASASDTALKTIKVKVTDRAFGEDGASPLCMRDPTVKAKRGRPQGEQMCLTQDAWNAKGVAFDTIATKKARK